MTMNLTATVGQPWDTHRGRTIQLHRPGHETETVGLLSQLPVGSRYGHDRWTLKLAPRLEDRLNDQQKLCLRQVIQNWEDLDQATAGGYVVAGMLLSWWLSNQLPRNTFEDLETAVTV